MSLREFLDVLGLPLADESLPEDRLARQEAKAVRLGQRLRKIEAALIRHRRVIEQLREQMRRGEDHSRRVERLEERYQFLLTRHTESRERLARLRGRIRLARTTSER